MVPNIPRTVFYHRTSDLGKRIDRASYVRHYDEGMSKVFRYFIIDSPHLIGVFTDSLGKGFSKDGYGPFWPSFASVNDGRADKVLWLSPAGLECLQVNLQPKFIFQASLPEEGE